MPKPNSYQRPGQHFTAFLSDAQEALDLPTSNATYTTVEAVFTVFRRRLTLEQTVSFAQVLPPILCALFLKTHNVDAKPLSFAPMADLEKEIRQFRGNHNFSPENSIPIVSTVLWRHADGRELRRVLKKLPEGAKNYWLKGMRDE
jgi:uncharacterized protein (DUF2267 family)